MNAEIYSKQNIFMWLKGLENIYFCEKIIELLVFFFTL